MGPIFYSNVVGKDTKSPLQTPLSICFRLVLSKASKCFPRPSSAQSNIDRGDLEAAHSWRVPWAGSDTRINCHCWLASGAEGSLMSGMSREWKYENTGCCFPAGWTICIDLEESTTLEEEAFASAMNFDEGQLPKS